MSNGFDPGTEAWRKLTEERDMWKAALEEANGLLRTTFQIADRDGEKTNWKPFKTKVKKALDAQHRLMYPENYDAERAGESE